MNYIILDLEWNQATYSPPVVRNSVVLNGEIIQIGAVKTDENFNFLDQIRINVRPKYYKRMNPHVEKITGIKSEDLALGEPFPTAFKRFTSWCGEEYRVITWGFDDIGVFCDNLRLHGENSAFGADYINLQLIFNKQTADEHLQCALSTAAEKLGIPIDVQVHDAANDAFLTYEVLKKLDMVRGIAEYADIPSAVAPISKEFFERVGENIIRDKRLKDVNCPYCNEKMRLRDWLFGSRKACKSVAECDEHGAFLVKLKAARISDGNCTVTRLIYAATEKDISSYENKLKKRRESLERRLKEKSAEDKKAEDKNEEKHDTV